MTLHLPLIILVCFLSGNLAKAEPLEGDNVTRVSEGKYSYVVSIANRNDSDLTEKLHRCTGVLITKKLVLTAAHCFTGRLLDQIRLLIGSVDLRKAKKYEPSMWITYNQWAESKNVTRKSSINDIAIIKLSDKVSSKIAKPARISCKKSGDLRNESVTLVGWGVTNENPDSPSRFLRDVKAKVFPNNICENIAHHIFKFKMSVPEKYLCTTSEPHAFLARGDSGAPVMKKNSVVAISRGTYPKISICDSCGPDTSGHKLNIHSSIDFYRDFITDVLKNY